MKKLIRITLMSDLCSGNGDGFAANVDVEVAHDQFGLPYIPGKRVKGLLKEAAIEIISVDETAESLFKPLFGTIGQEQGGGLRLGSGRLEDAKELIAEIRENTLYKDKILSCYTDIRKRTAIKDGHAAKESLRTCRVVKQWLPTFETQKLRTSFLFQADFPEECEPLLERCCRMLRSMGLNRTRGMGEVSCTLENTDHIDKTYSFVPSDYMESTKQVGYELHLDEPIIAADRNGRSFHTEDYIFGSTMQGFFANRWLKSHEINGEECAHNNEEFRRLFLSGDVIFTFAFPSVGEREFYPAPHTMRTNKTKSRFVDESAGQIETEMDDQPICKKMGGYVNVDGGTIRTYNVEKETYLHHSRPNDKRRGHAGGKTSEDGQLYSYEAISREQMFRGRILGNDRDICILANLIEADATAYFGRSRTAQYGQTHFASAQMAANSVVKVDTDMEFRIVARTPIILTDEAGAPTLDVRIVPKLLGNENLRIARAVCTETTVAGYNAKWGLPRPQVRAIEEGSVLILHNGGSPFNLPREQFIGALTHSGYGHIVVEPIEPTNFQVCEPVTAATSGSYTVKRLLPLIEKQMDLEQNIFEGERYASSLKQKHLPSNSQLVRLQNYLEASNDFDSFAKKLFDIKQPKIRDAAFYMFTGQPVEYFQKINPNLKLLSNIMAEGIDHKPLDYATFQSRMRSMLLYIKLIRRQAKHEGEVDTDE